MSSIKLTFDRESELESKYVVISKDLNEEYVETELGHIVYDENGKISIQHNGFKFSFEDVVELNVTITPLDALFTKVKFKIKSFDGSTKIIPIEFYGIRGTNVFISYISGSGDIETDTPDDIS